MNLLHLASYEFLCVASAQSIALSSREPCQVASSTCVPQVSAPRHLSHWDRPGVQILSWHKRGNLEYPLLESSFPQESRWGQSLCQSLRICPDSEAILGLNFCKVLFSLDSCFARASSSLSGASPTLSIISAASSFSTTSGVTPSSVSILVSSPGKRRWQSGILLSR